MKVKINLFLITLVVCQTLEGPITCLFEKKGFYFCGTQNDSPTSNNPKPTLPYRTNGYCCADSQSRDSISPQCNSNFCTPTSKNRKKNSPHKALYMAFTVGMRLGNKRREFCGASA